MLPNSPNNSLDPKNDKASATGSVTNDGTRQRKASLAYGAAQQDETATISGLDGDDDIGPVPGDKQQVTTDDNEQLPTGVPVSDSSAATGYTPFAHTTTPGHHTPSYDPPVYDEVNRIVADRVPDSADETLPPGTPHIDPPSFDGELSASPNEQGGGQQDHDQQDHGQRSDSESSNRFPGRSARPVTDAQNEVQTGDTEVGLRQGPLVAESAIQHTKKYEVMECIGEGGMGWIYRAHDRVLKRDVALKVRKPAVPQRERERFRQEALYGARFSYPSIVRVYDLYDDPSTESCWFAMEYLPGKDVEKILERVYESERPMPLRLIVDVFRQVLAALQYSHDCKIIHRDVKPSNMFVTRDQNTRFVTAKLLDFGVALDLENDPPADRLVGDPRYMAPEQTHVGAVIDHRADIYAAGMSLYKVITGRHPFEDLLESPSKELLGAQRDRIPLGLSNFLPPDTPPDLAHALEDIFFRATAKDPDDRYNSAREMQHHVMQLLDIGRE